MRMIGIEPMWSASPVWVWKECRRGTTSRSQDAQSGLRTTLSELGLVDVAVRDEQDLGVVSCRRRSRGRPPLRDADATDEASHCAVVDEADDLEPVARVTPEDLDDVGSECATADHERAMGDHPTLARREDEAAGGEPAEHDEAEPGKHDEQERLDALAVVAQCEHGRHEGGGDQESPHQHGELVEHREVQARAVASAAGEQGDRDDGGREDRFRVLREPQHRHREENGVDRQDEHPRLPVHRRPETQERSRGTRRQGLVIDGADLIDRHPLPCLPRPTPGVRRAPLSYVDRVASL